MFEYYCTITDHAYGAALKIVQSNLCNVTCHQAVEKTVSDVEEGFKSLSNLVSDKFYDDITFSNLVESLCGSLDSDNDGSYFFLSVGAVLGIGLSFCAYSFCTRVVDKNNYVKTQV